MKASIDEIMRKYRRRILTEVQRRQLLSVMNNTKWNELVSGLESLPFMPPYKLKNIFDEDNSKDYISDTWYTGNYDDEIIKPFFAIEWIQVRPRYVMHQGRLIEGKVIDETIEFVELLERLSIPYQEKDGSYIIYGYK